MRTTYTITPGQQYDPLGVRVAKHLPSGATMDTTYTREGRYHTGHPILAHRTEVEQVVARVLVSRRAETLVCGEPPAALTPEHVTMIAQMDDLPTAMDREDSDL